MQGKYTIIHLYTERLVKKLSMLSPAKIGWVVVDQLKVLAIAA